MSIFFTFIFLCFSLFSEESDSFDSCLHYPFDASKPVVEGCDYLLASRRSPFFALGLVYEKMQINGLYYAKQLDITPDLVSAAPGVVNYSQQTPDTLPNEGFYIGEQPPQGNLSAIIGTIDPNVGLAFCCGIPIGFDAWMGRCNFKWIRNSGVGGIDLSDSPSSGRAAAVDGDGMEIDSSKVASKIFTPSDLFLRDNVQEVFTSGVYLFNPEGNTTNHSPESFHFSVRNQGRYDNNTFPYFPASRFYREISYYQNAAYDVDISHCDLDISMAIPFSYTRSVSVEPHVGLDFVWNSFVRNVIFYGGMTQNITHGMDVFGVNDPGRSSSALENPQLGTSLSLGNNQVISVPEEGVLTFNPGIPELHDAVITIRRDGGYSGPDSHTLSTSLPATGSGPLFNYTISLTNPDGTVTDFVILGPGGVIPNPGVLLDIGGGIPIGATLELLPDGNHRLSSIPNLPSDLTILIDENGFGTVEGGFPDDHSIVVDHGVQKIVLPDGTAIRPFEELDSPPILLNNEGNVADVGDFVRMQKLAVDRLTRTFVENPNVLYHDQIDEFFGCGISFGFDTFWFLSRTLSLYCDSSISMLLGNHNVYDGLLFGLSRVDARDNKNYVETTDIFSIVSPSLKNRIGLRFDRGGFVSHCAFDVAYIWNQFYQISLSYNESRPEGIVLADVVDNGVFSMFGLYVDIGWLL